MIASLHDLLKVVDHLHAYLEGRGVRFNDDGFPLVDRSCFLAEKPVLVVPCSHRNARFVSDPSRTLVCFHTSDVLNYRRIERVLDELGEYRRFLAVSATDVTVTADMDIEWQAQIMLLNALFLAVVAVNDIKVVANLRCGNRDSMRYLSWIPKGVACIASSLGCDGLKDASDLSFISKVMLVRPDPLLLYGKRDEVALEQLRLMGFDPWCYSDAHTISKAETQRGREEAANALKRVAHEANLHQGGVHARTVG